MFAPALMEVGDRNTQTDDRSAYSRSMMQSSIRSANARCKSATASTLTPLLSGSPLDRRKTGLNVKRIATLDNTFAKLKGRWETIHFVDYAIGLSG